jgi:hypothetical protein
MRPREQYDEVDRLIRWGMNDCQISRLTGVPRTTVLGWRQAESSRRGFPGVGGRWKALHAARRPCQQLDRLTHVGRSYGYLLGLYLGDGCISPNKGGYRLRISLDERYPRIIRGCSLAIRRVRGASAGKISFLRHTGCIEVAASWDHWPCVFPQHGPGRKHKRTIELHHWQWDIVRAHPSFVLRGLIHSDGCRVINRVAGHEYPRYFFTNHSADIRSIFCRACDFYGVAWRQSRWQTISVARREAVARLDQVVGPKG